ncbi:hypothetical protein HU200_007112 [Digitaria exilis]|uniref:Rx N-terminal domain-containing protein n=1 Tax=Digitaria exilis TaxID=1010633 RepID=A0A835FP40_9POAL|nr:hypothetical protein HU200_007112 [Digitaria exilis]
MEIVKGALPSVLSKLGGLLINEYNLQKGLKGEIMVLETELERMQAALEKLSSIPPEQVDKQDKIWASISVFAVTLPMKSENPDEEKLFMEMSRQLATYGATIDAIRDFLLTKRSVVVFAYKVQCTPALPSFRVLRVLELDCNEISPDCCLKSLGYLLLLRYLRLTHYGIKEIPEEIPGESPEEIVNLRFLQVMLDWNITEPVAFPVVFQEGAMRRLKRLSSRSMCWRREMANGYGGLEFGLGNLPSLQELFLKASVSDDESYGGAEDEAATPNSIQMNDGLDNH